MLAKIRILDMNRINATEPFSQIEIRKVRSRIAFTQDVKRIVPLTCGEVLISNKSDYEVGTFELDTISIFLITKMH